MHVYMYIYNIFQIRNPDAIAKNTNGYLFIYNKEISITDRQITQADGEVPMSVFPPAIVFSLMKHTRCNFLLIVSEIGTLQEVMNTNGEQVNLLEAFCLDSNNIHLKVVFWAAYAEQVCRCIG